MRDHLAQLAGHPQDLEYAGSRPVALVLAAAAAVGGVDSPALAGFEPPVDRRKQLGLVNLERQLAVVTEGAHEPLGDDPQEARGEEVRRNAESQHALDRPGRSRRVERGEHEVAAVGRPNGRLRRHRVADLADHDHVGRLPQHAPQELGEFEALAVVDLRLADAGQGVLDRVLDRVDLPRVVVEAVEARVERGCLAGPGRPGDEHQSARLVEQVEQFELVLGVQPEILDLQQRQLPLEQPDRQVLAVERGDCADPQVGPPIAVERADPAAVLGALFLGHVHPRRRLHVGDEPRTLFTGDVRPAAEHPQVPHGDRHVVFVPVEVQVAGRQMDGLAYQPRKRLSHSGNVQIHVFRLELDPVAHRDHVWLLLHPRVLSENRVRDDRRRAWLGVDDPGRARPRP